MAVPPTLDLQGLLAEDQWIRRLARRLADDGHAAEDLVQDTWAAALDARSPAPRKLRPWLRGILRNLWIDRERARRARDAREHAVARGEALAETGELVAELELRKYVAEALLALEEPYRSALYLRFFKDHSLAALARRQGIGVTSAHERVQQGLALLRARLDREHGGRRKAWAAGMLSLAKPSGAGAAAVAEVVAMAGGFKLVASVVLVGGGVAWWWVEHDSEAARAPLAAAPAAVDSTMTAQAALASSGARAEPALRTEAAPESTPEAAVAPAPPLVHGHVCDPHGSPVAAARVGWSAPPEAAGALSAADGSFALADLSPANASILCREPDLVTLVPGEKAAVGRPESSLVVVARRAALAGVVLDPEGAPVARAKVRFGVRDALFRELGLHRGSLERPEWLTTSDEDGSFGLADAAAGGRFFLQVEAEGFWMAQVDVPEASATDLVIRLERADRERRITGIVLAPEGAAVAGARVSAGDAIVATDADGRFALSLGGRHGIFGPLVGAVESANEASEVYLVALKPGLLPAREALASLDLAEPVVLRLGPRLATIAGSVLDPERRPRAGVIVWARDPTPFGRAIEAMGEGTTVTWNQTVEDELAGGFGRWGAVSDGEGRFELGGLLERAYELMAFDPLTAELSGPWTIRAGSRAVELVLAREPRRGRVAGRVVSAGGRPLGGVKLSAQRTPAGNDAHAQPPQLARHSVTTDAEGRFEFAELALEGTRLVLEDARLFLRSVRLADHADPAHLELVEPVLCELQVDLTSDPAFADAVRVLDGEARELQTMESFGNGWSMGTEARLAQGLSPVVLVKETAETLVLYRQGVEVLRRPLALDPEQRTTIRP